MKERPGVMMYFTNRPCFDALPDADAGKLLKGFLSYAETGTLPALNGTLQLLFLLLKPSVDADAQRYERHCTQKRYAAYCREQNKLSLPKLPYEEWLLSADIDPYPNTETNTEPVSVPASDADTETKSTSLSAAEANKAQAPAKLGHHGKNRTIRLTDADYLDLMNEMGVSELCDTMLYAEPKAQELGYDAETLDWKAFLRKCWYTEVKPGSDQNKL